MAYTTCPIAMVDAPAERVWALLSEPANYAQWWEARWRIVAPAGCAQPGQRIEARSNALGWQWIVHITVELIDPAQRVIDLTTRMPFGITVHNHITCVPLDAATCRVSFG